MKVVYTSKMIYKRDSKGKTRIWLFEIGTDDEKWGWRTIAGIDTGKKVTSDWTIVEGKNVGKANETSPEEQAYLEGNADQVKKLAKGYFADSGAIDTFDKFKPMLAHNYDDYKDKLPRFVFAQPKLDGIRCVARKDGLWTRTGKPIQSVPHIWEEIQKLFAIYGDQLILDGELYNHELRDDFNQITSLVRKSYQSEEDIELSRNLIQYHIYDMLLSEKDKRPFVDRQSDLNLMGDHFIPNSPLYIVPTVIVDMSTDELDILNGEWVEQGYEGQMIRLDTPYENKRTKNLLKRKEFLTDEFKVLDILEGNGNWRGCVKHLLLEDFMGSTFKSGIRGSKDKLRVMWENKEAPDWVTIRYFMRTPDGVPRFPIAVDWGKGKRED